MKRKQSGEILSPTAKLARAVLAAVLIVYTLTTVFVIGITLLDSLKTKGDLVSNFVGLPRALSFESYRKLIKKADLFQNQKQRKDAHLYRHHHPYQKVCREERFPLKIIT